MSIYFTNTYNKEIHYQMATPYTTEDGLEMVTADDDVEHFDFGSDDELEFNNYDE